MGFWVGAAVVTGVELTAGAAVAGLATGVFAPADAAGGDEAAAADDPCAEVELDGGAALSTGASAAAGAVLSDAVGLEAVAWEP